MEPDTADLLACAHALDVRLHETLDDPFRLRRGRLYGATLTPADDDVPVKLCFLGEDRDIHGFIAGPIGLLAREFDAAVLAVTGWGAPMGDVGPGGVSRPSLHPQRTRVRACCAVGDAGVVSVFRSDREPDAVTETTDAEAGAMPEALRAMWSGGLLLPAPPRRGARSGRHRRPA